MWDLGALRDRGDFARRLAVTAVALIAYRLGAYIPLPGLDPTALAHVYQATGPATERVSVVALGVYPLVSVLILTELAKLAMPALRRWLQSDARNHDRLNRWVIWLAMGAAIVQGAGIAGALENVRTLVAEPGIPFRIACMTTLAAGTALVIWLADLITRHGLGSGVWLLFVVPALADLPLTIGALAGLVGEGSISATGALASLAFAVVAIAAIVMLVSPPHHTRQAAAVCLWPTLLSYALQPWVLIMFALAASGGDMTGVATWIEPGSGLRLAVLAVLLGLFVYFYMRAEPPVTGAIPPSAIWIVLTAITVCGEVLPARFGLPMPIEADNLIVIALVATLIFSAWRRPEPEAQSSGVK